MDERGLIGRYRRGPAISITDVSKRYRTTLAVDNLSLDIPQGVTLGLIGPNGAGKSTLIKMIMGLTRPTTGQIMVLGNSIMERPVEAKRRVGYVPENNSVYPWMTIAEAAQFTGHFYPAWSEDRYRMLMELFDLDQRKRIGELSKGMRTSVSLVLAAAHEPDLLVLDEPLSGLDPIGREAFMEGVLASTRERGTTVVFSSHLLEEVEKLVDGVAFIYLGKLLLHAQDCAELVRTTKVFVMKEINDELLAKLPNVLGVEQREGVKVTISGVDDELVANIRQAAGSALLRVEAMNLDGVYKAYVKSRRVRG